MNLNRFISVTSPIGTWEYKQLIGATVKIRHLPIKNGLFAFDNETEYKIEDIKFKMTSTGLSVGQVFLEGVSNPFEWKDLEIIGLDMVLYSDAICGCFCCGGTLCGYGHLCEEEEEKESTSENNLHNHCCDGIVLDK